MAERRGPRAPGEQLYRRDRLNAPGACEKNEWTEGTVLASEQWGQTRTIMYVGSVEIELRFDRTHKRQYCKTLPGDTHAV